MRFLEISKMEIKDNETGLIWRNEFINLKSFDDANSYAKEISKETKQSWRVPSLKESISLIDYTKYNPASKFPYQANFKFLVSSSYIGDDNKVWYVNFLDGGIGCCCIQDIGNFEYVVRLVRNET